MAAVVMATMPMPAAMIGAAVSTVGRRGGRWIRWTWVVSLVLVGLGLVGRLLMACGRRSTGERGAAGGVGCRLLGGPFGPGRVAVGGEDFARRAMTRRWSRARRAARRAGLRARSSCPLRMAESTRVRCSASRWACEPPKRARFVRIGISLATTSSWRPSAWASTARRRAGRSRRSWDVRGRRGGGDVGASRSMTARASSSRPAPARAMTAWRSLNAYHGL